LVVIVCHCVLVTANCSVRVQSYSAYGSCRDPAYVSYGYVKLNGVAVWQGSWCGNYSNLRGVNTVLIDPFTCTKLDSRRFDTHASSAAATALSTYLHVVNHGTIIVGVSGDAARDALNNALSTLRQMRVEVADLQQRGSFAFIAQKDFSAKTVFRKVLTEIESYRQAAYVNAIITGTQTVVGLHGCV